MRCEWLRGFSNPLPAVQDSPYLATLAGGEFCGYSSPVFREKYRGGGIAGGVEFYAPEVRPYVRTDVRSGRLRGCFLLLYRYRTYQRYVPTFV